MHASDDVPLKQSAVFKDAYVLGNSGLGNIELFRYLADRERAAREALDDSPSSRVCKRAEDAIQGRDIVNHVVI